MDIHTRQMAAMYEAEVRRLKALVVARGECIAELRARIAELEGPPRSLKEIRRNNAACDWHDREAKNQRR